MSVVVWRLRRTERGSGLASVECASSSELTDQGPPNSKMERQKGTLGLFWPSVGLGGLCFSAERESPGPLERRCVICRSCWARDGQWRGGAVTRIVPEETVCCMETVEIQWKPY